MEWQKFPFQPAPLAAETGGRVARGGRGFTVIGFRWKAFVLGAGLVGWLIGGTAAAAPAGISLAEAGFSVAHWTVEDGLPLQNVTALAQTPDGYLWCGTFDGLARFDGMEFKIFYPHEVPALEGFQITALHGDAQGRLWIGDDRGKLAVWENGSFRRLEGKDGLPGAAAGEITEALDGVVWVRGLVDGNFYRLRTNRFERFVHPSVQGLQVSQFRVDESGLTWGLRTADRSLIRFTPEGLVDQPLSVPGSLPEKLGGFLDLDDGTLAVTSAHGVYICDGSRWILQDPFDPPIRQAEPLGGCQDRQRNYWIGTRGGGLWLSRKGKLTGRVILPNEGIGDTVHSLIRGREGNIWIGSSAGLYRIRQNLIATWTDGEGAPREPVRSMAEDTNQRLWLVQEGGVKWLTKKTNTLFAIPFDREKLTAWRAAPARDGGIWLGVGWRNGKRCEIWHVTPDRTANLGEVPSESVDDILESNIGVLWVGTPTGLFRREGAGFTKVRLTTEPESRPVNALVADRTGRLHAAVAGVGLFRLEPGGWRRLTQASDQGSDRIQALCFDAQDTLWIAADRPGLARWKQEQWFGFLGLEGELPRKARTLATDDQDGLWLSSRWGLVRVSRRKLNDRADQHGEEVNSTWFDRDDGLVSINCANARSGIVKDHHGRIWVATAQGVSMIDPTDWTRQRGLAVPSPVRIEQVLVDDVPVAREPPGIHAAASEPPHFVVPASHQPLEIRYAGINLTAPEKMHFRYRLEGFDRGWTKLTGARSVHFPRLPPGDYRFQVVSVNNDGVWNHEGASISLTVRPEWWQRMSVRAMAGLGLVGLIWLAGQIRIRRLQRQRAMQSEFSRQLIRSQEQERKRIAGELHDSLGQNLLVAKNLALLGVNASAENPEAAKQFGEISAAVSTALAEARSLSRALRPPELDRLGLTEALRGMVQRTCEAGGLRCELRMEDIDGLLPAAEEINLYRLVQEGMSNIVKHAHARRAEIEVLHHPDHLALRIADDGQGFDAVRLRDRDSGNSGTGLSGMAERTHLAGGEFEVSSQSGKGTVLKIRIPVRSPQT